MVNSVEDDVAVYILADIEFFVEVLKLTKLMFSSRLSSSVVEWECCSLAGLTSRSHNVGQTLVVRFDFGTSGDIVYVNVCLTKNVSHKYYIFSQIKLYFSSVPNITCLPWSSAPVQPCRQTCPGSTRPCSHSAPCLLKTVLSSYRLSRLIILSRPTSWDTTSLLL